MASDETSAMHCELCTGKYKKEPVTVVCNTCRVNMCNNCLAKHVYSFLSVRHDIVGFKFSKSEDISLPCKLHANSKCELYCQDCYVPVCLKCIASGFHKSHDLDEICKRYFKQRTTIQQDIDELKTILRPTYTELVQEIKTKITAALEGYSNLKQSIRQQGQIWHDEVDVIIKLNIASAEKMEKEDLGLLRNLQSQVQNLLENVNEAVQNNTETLKSNDCSGIFHFKILSDHFRYLPSTIELSFPQFISTSINKKLLTNMFGELMPSARTDVPGYVIPPSYKMPSTHKKQIFDKTKEINAFQTGYKSAYRVCNVLDTKQIYVKGETLNIKCFTEDGKVSKTFQTENAPYDIAVTKSGQLIYTDYDDRTVKTIVDDTEDDVIRIQGWKPMAVCVAANEDLIISMDSNDKQRHKIVRYKGITVRLEIQFDEMGRPLYSEAHFIAENKNLQICVSDWGNKTVVVTDKMGKYLFSYDGKDKNETFNPSGIAADSQCHILVADCRNQSIHIINHRGGFISYIKKCQSPYGLSITNDDTLYVTDRNSAKLRVLKYLDDSNPEGI